MENGQKKKLHQVIENIEITFWKTWVTTTQAKKQLENILAGISAEEKEYIRQQLKKRKEKYSKDLLMNLYNIDKLITITKIKTKTIEEDEDAIQTKGIHTVTKRIHMVPGFDIQRIKAEDDNEEVIIPTAHEEPIIEKSVVVKEEPIVKEKKEPKKVEQLTIPWLFEQIAEPVTIVSEPKVEPVIEKTEELSGIEKTEEPVVTTEEENPTQEKEKKPSGRKKFMERFKRKNKSKKQLMMELNEALSRSETNVAKIDDEIKKIMMNGEKE